MSMHPVEPAAFEKDENIVSRGMVVATEGGLALRIAPLKIDLAQLGTCQCLFNYVVG